MTLLVKQLIDRIEALPETQQDWVVKNFLAQLQPVPKVDQKPTVADLLINGDKPLWMTATPEELAESWTQWVDSHIGGPGIPGEALRRDNMYD